MEWEPYDLWKKYIKTKYMYNIKNVLSSFMHAWQQSFMVELHTN